MYANSSTEFKERWHEIMWGKDGKSGAIKEPYADRMASLIPDGVKLLTHIKHTECPFCKTPCNNEHCPYTEKK